MAYVVTAPYITLRVKDVAGAWTLVGFYRDTVVNAEIDPASLKHHLDGEMIEEVAGPAKVTVPDDAEPPTPVVDVPPSKNADKEAWVTYAVSKRADGVSEKDARDVAEFKTKADLIAEFGS